MASDSSDDNGSSDFHIQKKQRTEENTGITMMFLDVLDCPVCCEPLTVPVFQCDNGHMACSSCCPKLSNECPECTLPIGNNRCIAMERVLGSVLIRCPNAEFGCTQKVSYWKKSTHVKECTFSQCSCPDLDCDYTGSYKDLYSHYLYCHKFIYLRTGLTCDKFYDVRMTVNDKMLVQREYKKRLLFAVQCFREANGVLITVTCIAPSAREVGEFSYHLSYTTVDGNVMTYESTVKRMIELSFQRPEENYMLIPHSLLCGEQVNIKLCIKEVEPRRVRMLG